MTLATHTAATLALLLGLSAHAANPSVVPLGVGDDGGFGLVYNSSDGSFFAAGHAGELYGAHLAVSAHTDVDAIDTAFGIDGVATAVDVYGHTGTANAAVTDGAGGVVVVGWRISEYGGAAGGVMIHFDSTGAVVWERAIGSMLADVVRDGSGRYVAVGTSGEDTSADVIVARVLSDGTLDTNFHSTGTHVIDVGCGGQPTQDAGTALALQTNGRIVVGGTVDHWLGGACGLDTDHLVMRLYANGNLDTSFGVGGKVTIEQGADEGVSRLLLRPDGRIVVVGNSTTSGPPRARTLGLALLKKGGGLDTTFGVGGHITWALDSSTTANDALLLSDGRIVVTGRVGPFGAGGDVLVARFSSDGNTLDTTFDDDGIVRVHIGTFPDALSAGHAIAARSDGGFVIGGVHKARTSVGTAGDLLLVNVDDDGTVTGDPSRPGPHAVGRFSYSEPAVTIPTPGNTSPTVSAPIVADVAYPADVAGGGVPISGAQSRWPVVLISHGRHPSTAVWMGFDYLLDHLASHGFIAVAIDGASLYRTYQEIETVRARLLLAHLDELAVQDGSTGILGGAIDLEQIALIGHSQGGGSVLQAVRVNEDEGLGWNIAAVTALAPSDTSASPTTLTTTKYLCLYGSMDGDIGSFSGFPFSSGANGTGFRAYDRHTSEKAMVYIPEATHNLFNTEMGSEWSSYPDAVTLDAPTHHGLLKGYTNAFLQWQINGDSSHAGYFDGALRIPAVSVVDVRRQYQNPADRRVIDDFNDADANTNSLAGLNTSSGLDSVMQGVLGDLERSAPHTARGMKLRWTTAGTWVTRVPSGSRNLSAYHDLSFRVGQTYGFMGYLSDAYSGALDAGVMSAAFNADFASHTGIVLSPTATVATITAGSRWRIADGDDRLYTLDRDERAYAGSPYWVLSVWREGSAQNHGVDQRFSVRLTSTDGRSWAVPVSSFARVRPPQLPDQGARGSDGSLSPDIERERTLAELSTVHMPLAVWAASVDLTRVSHIGFEFAPYTTGELMFDDLEVVR